MGKWRRNGPNPACISAAIARAQRARRRIGGPETGHREISRQDIRGLPATPRRARCRRSSAGTLPVLETLRHARLEIRGLERDHLFLESNARDLHGDPWPKRPGGIVLVADDELERHARPCAVVVRYGAMVRGAGGGGQAAARRGARSEATQRAIRNSLPGDVSARSELRRVR